MKSVVPEYFILLAMFVKNVLNMLVISNVLVISLPFTLRGVGDVFLFPFFLEYFINRFPSISNIICFIFLKRVC